MPKSEFRSAPTHSWKQKHDDSDYLNAIAQQSKP
jgi:hypothetical protein